MNYGNLLKSLFFVALFYCSDSLATGHCVSLFQNDNNRNYEIKDPSLPGCIRSLFGCARSVNIPLGEKFGPVFLNKFPNTKKILWSLHHSEGIKEVNVLPYDLKSTPVLRETRNGKQIEAPMRIIDHYLNELSNHDTEAKENAIVQLFDAHGKNVYRSPQPIPGDVNSVRVSPIEAEISANLHNSKTKIEYVEIIHSHPFQELFVELIKPKGPPFKLIYHPLSPPDVAYGVQFSLLLPNVKIAITAVTPNGKRYSAIFLNDQNISEVSLLAP